MALLIKISSDSPDPNGKHAKVSKSSNGKHPNQAQWKAKDDDYDVTLPSTVWTPPTGGSLSFTVTKNNTSGVYTVKTDAPTGAQSYSISASSGLGSGQPEVMVDP